MTTLLLFLRGAAAWVMKALPAVWAWCRKHPVATPWILVGILSALLALAWWPVKPAPVPQGSATEAAGANAAGASVVQAVPKERLSADEQRALAEVPELKASKAALEAEIGRLTLVAILRGKTKPAPAHGPERPGEQPVAPGSQAQPPVLLRDGDKLVLGVDGAAYRGPKGTETLLVPVSVARDSDGVVLLREPLAVQWTEAERQGTPAPKSERQWRLGPVAGPMGQGWVAGAAYSKRLDLWGWKPEAMVAGAGGRGQGVLVAGFLF